METSETSDNIVLSVLLHLSDSATGVVIIFVLFAIAGLRLSWPKLGPLFSRWVTLQFLSKHCPPHVSILTKTGEPGIVVVDGANVTTLTVLHYTGIVTGEMQSAHWKMEMKGKKRPKSFTNPIHPSPSYLSKLRVDESLLNGHQHFYLVRGGDFRVDTPADRVFTSAAKLASLIAASNIIDKRNADAQTKIVSSLIKQGAKLCHRRAKVSTDNPREATE
ncbi:hypothetical protein [Enterovibrio norvegicus]|uniref:hypothetical protein n=1 Tax=Enterovibrio norvegicus TaxID=188144 RepID=UPI00352EDD8C